MTLAISANQAHSVIGASHLLTTRRRLRENDAISVSASFPKGKAAGVGKPQGPGLFVTGVNSLRPAGLTALKDGAHQSPLTRADMNTQPQAESAQNFPHTFDTLDTCDRINALRRMIAVARLAVLGFADSGTKDDAWSVDDLLFKLEDKASAISKDMRG